ncbi:transcriptional repressor [Candidatus Binatia bacterium]|nr:transcriptional repressor [Candidatus Binatia bacterium]
MSERLQGHGIQASAQRVAVAEYALRTTDHPSADVVWAKVRESFPFLSRATVYNTLNLFVAKGLLRPLVIAEGRVVFDPNVEPHHHFVDEETGEIHDVPWDAVAIRSIEPPRDFELRDYQVIMRGSRRGRPARARPRGSSRSSVK